MARSPGRILRSFAVATELSVLLTLGGVACSSSLARYEFPADTGGSSNESGGAPSGGSSGDSLTEVTDAGQSLAVYIEDGGGGAVQTVTLRCAGDCTDIVAAPTGGYAPYTFAWDDGSTTATRHVCPTSTTSYAVSVTDSGIPSGEFSQAALTARASVTATVVGCSLDAGSPDGGTCSLPIGGTYVGTYTMTNLAGLQGGAMTMKLSKGSGTHVSGSIDFNLVGVLHAEFPLDGQVDCATGELVLRGVSSDSNGSLCACGGRPWVFTPTFDPGAQTLIGDWAYHSVTSTATPPVSPPPPAPHEKAILPVGDNGTLSLKLTGP